MYFILNRVTTQVLIVSMSQISLEDVRTAYALPKMQDMWRHVSLRDSNGQGKLSKHDVEKE
jgi:hypothetical protein